MKIDNFEYKAIVALPSNKRMQYLIKRIADTEFLYALGYENGDLEIFEVNGRKYIPIWPFKEFAKGYKQMISKMEDLYIHKIKIYDMRSLFESSFTKNNIEFFDLFPINELTANIIEIKDFYDMLDDELNDYY